MTLYVVYLLADDATPVVLTLRAVSVDAAETVALAEASERWPVRGWLVSHVEADER